MITGPASAGGIQAAAGYLRIAPQVMDEEEVAALQEKTSPQSVQESVQKLYYALLSPGGGWMQTVLTQDPLGFHETALRRLRRLAAGAEYRVEVRDGLLVSEDHQHALIILETPVGITDGEGAKKLLQHLEEQASKCGDFGFDDQRT